MGKPQEIGQESGGSSGGGRAVTISHKEYREAGLFRQPEVTAIREKQKDKSLTSNLIQPNGSLLPILFSLSSKLMSLKTFLIYLCNVALSSPPSSTLYTIFWWMYQNLALSHVLFLLQSDLLLHSMTAGIIMSTLFFIASSTARRVSGI